MHCGGEACQCGQLQLLSIARAAVSDLPVMILDEATSSIDTRTEKFVQDGMDNLIMGRTVCGIAHRLSTVGNADVIMVLDHGRITSVAAMSSSWPKRACTTGFLPVPLNFPD